MPDVVLPVLDEAGALPWVLGRMPAGYVPLVVDNGSTDGSARIAESFGARVVVEPNRGFGSACWAGLMSSEADVVCFMDADGSLDPAHLPLVAEPVITTNAELAVGERRAAPGAWPVHARLGNRLVAWQVRRRTGLPIRDLGPMRAARRSRLVELDMQDRRSGWPLEMVLKAVVAGWTIVTVDVPYLRRSGRSKVTGTLRGTAQAVRDMGRLLA